MGIISVESIQSYPTVAMIKSNEHFMCLTD